MMTRQRAYRILGFTHKGVCTAAMLHTRLKGTFRNAEHAANCYIAALWCAADAKLLDVSIAKRLQRDYWFNEAPNLRASMPACRAKIETLLRLLEPIKSEEVQFTIQVWNIRDLLR
ncbi:hypothetical protein FJZ39_00985 [Candidatus Saccharibacteria bacterium]|nr:hypothetical protein [Candidatus Saccharibacteria bacterium]